MTTETEARIEWIAKILALLDRMDAGYARLDAALVRLTDEYNKARSDAALVNLMNEYDKSFKKFLDDMRQEADRQRMHEQTKNPKHDGSLH